MFAIIGANFSCCATYGQGTGDIVLDDLTCTGTETSLFACGHGGINTHNCGHSEDVGVSCLGKLLSTCKAGRSWFINYINNSSLAARFKYLLIV